MSLEPLDAPLEEAPDCSLTFVPAHWHDLPPFSPLLGLNTSGCYLKDQQRQPLKSYYISRNSTFTKGEVLFAHQTHFFPEYYEVCPVCFRRVWIFADPTTSLASLSILVVANGVFDTSDLVLFQLDNIL